jgi:hypothetical protein
MTRIYQTVFPARLKTSYVVLNQTFRRFLLENDSNSLTETPAWADNFSDWCAASWQCPQVRNTKLWSEIGKQAKFSIDKVRRDDKYLSLDGTENTAGGCFIYLANVVTIKYYLFQKEANFASAEKCSSIKKLGGKMCSNIGVFRLDVNGGSGPNILGRDIFIFYISDDGTLYPNGGKDVALWKSQVSLDKNPYYWKISETLGHGEYAAGRIMEEGWEMKY